ncbi:hypothetical protein F5B17DRAFT_444341 [Nemania serpens]|nr:hypothetical protein F5B17DRAFT_444341 [Nemania serpens]
MAAIIPPSSSNEPGSRSGMGPSSADSRRKSCLSRPSPSLGYPTHYRQQSLPSLNQATRVSLANPLSFAVIPPSPSEWKNTIHDVKQRYLARKYRSCSMQCSEILDNIGDTSAIEPLYLIYLHFYAASSFEWCALPLSSSSAYRTKLLSSAQSHYAEAEALIAAAEWNMTERARTPSAAFTASPSSPGLSAGSRTSDESSTASSPRTSIFFSDDESPSKLARSVRVKPKKKVSFSGLPEFFEFQPEPYIRPDSPTLGWDSDGPIRTTAHFGSKPFLRTNVGSDMAVIPEPANSVIARTDQEYHFDQERSNTPSNHVFDLESFLQTRTLNRFRSQLSALRDQVARHRNAVDGLLLAISGETPIPTPTTPLDEPEIPLPSTRLLSPTLSALGDEKTLQDRIARLRASGWRRKRFDGRRYEALREQVLGELEACS